MNYINKTPIDFYSHPCCPFGKPVMMTAKQLNLQLNPITIDITEDQNLSHEYRRLNPTTSVPTITDGELILWDSRAIMKYLCNKYGQESGLYPHEPRDRALVDRWLFFDISLYESLRAPLITRHKALEPTEDELKPLKDNLKVMNELIGDNMYLVSNHLTIADLAIVVTISLLGGHVQVLSNSDMSQYPNVIAWSERLQSELHYADFESNEKKAFKTFQKKILAKLERHQ